MNDVNTLANVNKILSGEKSINVEVGFSKQDILYLGLALFVVGMAVATLAILISKSVNKNG